MGLSLSRMVLEKEIEMELFLVPYRRLSPPLYALKRGNTCTRGEDVREGGPRTPFCHKTREKNNKKNMSSTTDPEAELEVLEGRQRTLVRLQAAGDVDADLRLVRQGP